MLLSKAIVNFAILCFFSGLGHAMFAPHDHDGVTHEEKPCSAPECSPGLESENSKFKLSKRMPSFDPSQAAIIVFANVAPILSLGFTRLVLRESENADGTLPYSRITATDLGVETVVTQAMGLVNGRNDLFYPTVPTSLVAQNIVAEAFITLIVGRGIDSWGSAVQLLDPTGGNNFAAGQNVVATYIRQAISYVLSNSLEYAAFEFTRLISVNSQLPTDPQGVVMMLYVQIFHP